MYKYEKLIVELYKSNTDLDTIIKITNRGISQSKFLLTLLKNDMKLYIILEAAITKLHHFSCPSTIAEVSELINKYVDINPVCFSYWLNQLTDTTVLNGFTFKHIDLYDKLLGYHIQERPHSSNCIEKEVQFISQEKWRYKFATKRKLVIGGLSNKKESDILIEKTYKHLIRTI